jgi:CheY-like chemotaxis protein
MITPSEILNARILIVDDLQFNLSVLERMLQNAGYTATTATTRPEHVCALQAKNRYDLVLLDIEMPGMNGFQVMEQLHAAVADDYPPVLVITGQADHKLRALQAGAKDFVSKPFEAIEVMTRVHNLLETRLLARRWEDHREDNPALSSIIQRNIRKIIQVRLQAVVAQTLQERIAHRISTFFGSMAFLYLHIVWFVVWMAFNSGRIGIAAFDPFPYVLLTTTVSLEAVFLTTFVLISQNLLGKESERLTDLGLHTALMTEHELTRVLQMLRVIQGKIGIANTDDSKLADADLEMETNPNDVLTEMARLQKRESHRARHWQRPAP